jgi:hypothetical protein
MTQPTNDNRLRRIRGGSRHHDDASGVLSSARSSVAPTARIIYVGFRTTLAGRTPR